LGAIVGEGLSTHYVSLRVQWLRGGRGTSYTASRRAAASPASASSSFSRSSGLIRNPFMPASKQA